MALYTCKEVQMLIDLYFDKDGSMAIIDIGSLGYGFRILYGEGLKTTVIKEKYLNEWSSAHTIRMYNKCPKKYEDLIERYENGEFDEEEN